jgi:cobaltochelatase CobN
MGVRRQWDGISGRVTGFEIMPPDLLDRPRVDVTLRISGFFRDAFPHQIDLFDSAVRAVAALDEPAAEPDRRPREPPIRKRLVDAGVDAGPRRAVPGYRVFGSKPGAYGAGLQALIDEKGWETGRPRRSLYRLGRLCLWRRGAEGRRSTVCSRTASGRVQAVVHNQDNREHDLLDSDDYYQFEGGMTAAVRQR